MKKHQLVTSNDMWPIVYGAFKHLMKDDIVDYCVLRISMNPNKSFIRYKSRDSQVLYSPYSMKEHAITPKLAESIVEKIRAITDLPKSFSDLMVKVDPNEVLEFQMKYHPFLRGNQHVS
jgi:hypothetical protein